MKPSLLLSRRVDGRGAAATGCGWAAIAVVAAARGASRPGRRRRCAIGLALSAASRRLALVAARSAGAGLVARCRAAGRARAGSRCATPCSASRGPATRRASSCSRSASGASSSWASGRCRRACCDEFSLEMSARRAGHVPASTSSRTRRTASGRSCRADRAARPVPADPGAARRVVAGARAARQPRELEDVRGPGLAGARVRRSPTATSLEPNERIVERALLATDGAAREHEPRCRSSRSVHERFGIDVGDVDAVRHPRPRRSTRGSPACATSTGATRATAASCSCSGPGCSNSAPHTLHRARAGAGGSPAARARLQHDLVDAVPERVGHRLSARSSRRSRRRVDNGDARRSRWSAASCCSAAP